MVGNIGRRRLRGTFSNQIEKVHKNPGVCSEKNKRKCMKRLINGSEAREVFRYREK